MHAGRIPITAPHELQLLRSRRGKHAAFSLFFQTICLACHNKEQAKQCCKEKHFPPWLHKQVDETAKKLCAASFFMSVHPAEASLHV